MNVSSDVLDVLSNAVINENALVLVGQLNRDLYVKTNKVLEAAGGNRSPARGFVRRVRYGGQHCDRETNRA